MIGFAQVLAAAWRIARRDAGVLLSVAAPFLMLPLLAVHLMADRLPNLPLSADEATAEASLSTLKAWFQANAGWYLGANFLSIFGAATLALLLVAPERPTVGQAMARATRLFPRFLLAGILVAIPVGLGYRLLVLPGLYLWARLCATMPALAGGQPLAATGALARSWRLTAPRQWWFAGAVVMLFVAQIVVAAPFAGLDAWLRAPGHLNPFVLVLADLGLASVEAAFHLGVLLLGVVAYRAGASRGA